MLLALQSTEAAAQGFTCLSAQEQFACKQCTQMTLHQPRPDNVIKGGISDARPPAAAYARAHHSLHFSNRLLHLAAAELNFDLLPTSVASLGRLPVVHGLLLSNADIQKADNSRQLAMQCLSLG
jgi:hypothetical protein